MAASDNVGSVFDCPICFEKLNYPKYLPCLHTFCETCIQSFIDSSLLDTNNYTKHVICPVCRIRIEPPFSNITAEEWAKHLPLNHQLIAFKDSCLNEDKTVLECDSCRVSERKKITAIYRCQQCEDNLCKACFEIIHKRIPKHTAVDLRKTKEKTDTLEKCFAHPGKSIQIYCFDHEKFGCSFCLTTEHIECNTVLTLDKISENDLEKSTKRLIEGTRQMVHSTRIGIEAKKENIKRLQEREDEIIQTVACKINDIKQRLDFLFLQLKSSINKTNKEKISNLSIGLTELISFNDALLETEKAASAVIKKENKNEIIIAMEKTKKEVFSLLKGLASQKHHMKVAEIKWNYVGIIERLFNLTKIGDVRYLFRHADWVSEIERNFHEMEKEVNLKVIAYGQVEMKRLNPRRILQIQTKEFSTPVADNPIVIALYIGDTSWSNSYSIRPEWSKVLECLKIKRILEFHSVPSLLLNPDKTFNAFGYEAQENYSKLCGDNNEKQYYYFENITSIFERNQDNVEQRNMTDVSGKDMGALEVFMIAIKYLTMDIFEMISNINLDAKFVIVVASHWNEHTRRFLREAALKVGIQSPSIVLKAEAAFFHYQYSAAKGNCEGTQTIEGKQIFTADLGDQNSTLTVHRKNEDGHSDEVLKMGIGSWGLQSMVADFESFLAEIVGDGTMQKFKTNFTNCYSDMIRHLKSKLHWQGADGLRISDFPARTIEECRLDVPWSSFQEAVEMSAFAGKILIRKSSNTLVCEKELALERVFEKTISQIKTYLKDVMDMEDIDTLLLIGSFAECHVVQNAVRETLSPKRVVVVTNEEVRSGGVYIGHMTK